MPGSRLTSLGLDGITLVGFDPDVDTYSVSETTRCFKMNPVVEDEGAGYTIRVNNDVCRAGQFATLNAGANVISVTVVNDSSTSMYVVIVTTTARVLITTQPTNKTVTVGNGAAFSVTTVSGVVAYQWQYMTTYSSNWTDVSGGTSRTLTISNATTSMNGRHYRCVVKTSPIDYDVSNAALLTVRNT